MKYGLSESEVKRIIQDELDKNPDLKYYINNPYFNEMLSLLIDGVSKAIICNGEKILNDIERELRNRNRLRL